MIEVILREDVEHLGKAGAVVRVKPGYARNYLLPRGLAFEATEGNRKRIAAEQQARQARLAAERLNADQLAAALGALTLTLTAKAGEEGRLFGSVTAQDIAEALASRGFTVDKRRIELEHPIKQLGTHSVTVRLHPDVTAQLQVTVEPE
jgi:large subunit ribosomal protein L9